MCLTPSVLRNIAALRSCLLVLASPLLLAQPLLAKKPGAIPVQSGQTVAFLGDSITQGGAQPGGYCQLVVDGLKSEGIEVKPVFAGISGHKSNQMLDRLDKDVIGKNPDWMTLSCGVNDVWHGAKGVDLASYKKNISEIIDKAQAAGIQVMVLTSTMINEDASNAHNQKLLDYNVALREIAADKGCLLADLNQEMQDALKSPPASTPVGKKLTTDGVHMNPYGNIMMAKGVLKAFGVAEAKLAKMESGWKSIPTTRGTRARIILSLDEYEAIVEKTGMTPEAILTEGLDAKALEYLGKARERSSKP